MTLLNVKNGKEVNLSKMLLNNFNSHERNVIFCIKHRSWFITSAAIYNNLSKVFKSCFLVVKLKSSSHECILD